MKPNHLYFILIACFCLAFIGLFGVVFGANKVLGQQANKLSNLRALNDAAQLQQTSLIQDKADITKYSTLNTIAASVVPQDKDQAEAVEQIVNIAAANGIAQLSSITFPASTLGDTIGGSKPNLTQLTPVAGIPGVYSLPITVTQVAGHSVSYNDFINFLSGLEQNRRTAQVTSINISPDAQTPSNVTFMLTINEYIKP